MKAEAKDQVVAGVKAEASAEDLDERAGKLDLQLAYLWRVHGVDYYAGKEAADPMSFSARATAARTLRGPKPEEGEQIAEADGMPTEIAFWLADLMLGTAHAASPWFHFQRPVVGGISQKRGADAGRPFANLRICLNVWFWSSL